MNHVSTASRWLLLAAGLASGCMMEVAPESDLHVDTQEQALDFAIPTLRPEPPVTEIPSCWWVTGREDCDAKPDCAREAPSDDDDTRRTGPTTRTAVAPSSAPSRVITTSTISLSTGTGSYGPAGSITDLTDDSCPHPNGVGTCSTCKRQYSTPWIASLELGLASRVLITNGVNDAYVVKNYVALNAKGLLPHVDVNLAAGTTLSKVGTVNYTDDLYMFFTSEFETGLYPVGHWVFCPKNGSTCVQVTD